MKIPISPPNFNALVSRVSEDPDRLVELMSLKTNTDSNGKYYHWDKLRHLKLPAQFSNHGEWWITVKFSRLAFYKNIPHSDKSGRPFVYAEPDTVRRLLHEIDVQGAGELRTTEQVTNPSTRDTYLINSLIEESITSSQLEGAATTRKVAKEMIRLKRKPRDKSETMILNNYHAMEYIKEISEEELTPELIYELHNILCKDTQDDPNTVGKLRLSDNIYVGDDRDTTILHVPPKAKELENRINNICNFANTDSSIEFMHPIIKAIILHFMLAYDHPFEDGNGRTARALFYWSMLKQGFWTMEFISISRILKSAPAKYSRAYLYTETDDNDVTYFLTHQLEVIKKAINDLLIYLKKKSNESKVVEKLISKSPYIQNIFNYRQIALINRALKNPDAVFNVESHRGSHNVTYDTARTDLLKLEKMKLLKKTKVGKAFVFSAIPNLKEKLDKIK